MSDCRFGISPVNYPDPDPEDGHYLKTTGQSRLLGPDSSVLTHVNSESVHLLAR